MNKARRPARSLRPASRILPVLVTAALASLAVVGIPAADAAASPRCQGERATIVGTAGRDVLNGTNGRDVIWGGGGNDRISARNGDDLVCAGPGDDYVHAGNGADRVFGEGGDDELDSSTGHDDVVDGGGGDDRLTGSSEGAQLRGGTGNDDLEGKEEGVILDGGAGNDRLLAHWIGLVLRGGDGDDLIDGYWARDADVDAGPGNDTIETGGGLDGSAAKPILGGLGDDHILGQGGRDYIDAGPGNDTVDLGDGDGGWAKGGPGNDTMTTGATTKTALYGDDDNDTLTLAESGSTAEGGAGDDSLTGSIWDETLDGGDGADSAHGGQGDDNLLGGAGDDHLWGEEGDDTCAGGPGQDECDGGPLGTPEPSSEDPDLCKSDIEVMINCRAENGDWSGTAQGTLVYYGSITETWSARVDMDELAPDYYWLGDADIDWRVAGTDDAGCTYDGAAVLDGRAELTIFDTTYATRIWPTTVQAPVVVDCPSSDPETVLFHPMNTNAAEAEDKALPQPPVTELVGIATYVPLNTPDGEATWTWDLKRAP